MATLLAVLVTLFVQSSAPAAERKLPFTDGWEVKGERASVSREGDREVLSLESGFAYRRDVSLEDGSIDFDVRLTRRRSFVYVMLRMENDREYEEFYLRPHKSGLPDSIQYAPVWQGRSGWQLHHGPGGTAAIEFEPGAWIHVRVVLQGPQAALFVGDMTAPALLVPRLGHSPRAGYIALRGSLPAGVPGSGPIAHFSNVVVRPGVVPFDFRSVVKSSPAAEAGVIRAWALSQAFVPGKEGAVALPTAGMPGAFRVVETQQDGMIELHQYVKIPAGNDPTAAVARVQVRAPKAGVYAFDLGFSDIATVFVNGRPLFRGDASYSYDTPRREGLIGFDQARLFLPLDAGSNDLSILVSDSFGGWGVMGRFMPADGITTEAR